MSVEKVKAGYWDLFQQPIVDDSTLRYEEVEILEDSNNLGNVGSSDLLYFRTKDVDDMYIPSDGYIQVQFRIEDGSTGNGYAAGANIALINNGFSLFQEATLQLDEQTVEQKQFLGLGSTILNLMEYTEDYARSVGTQEFWYPDSGTTGVNDITPFTTVGNPITAISLDPAYNAGHDARRLRTDDGRWVTIRLPLKNIFGFLKDNQIALRGNRIIVRLQRNMNFNQILLRDGAVNANARVVFRRCSIWMPVLRPSLEVAAELNERIAKGESVKLAWKQWETFRFQSQPNGTTSLVWRVSSTRAKPTAVYLAMQLDTRASDQQVNGGLFDHMSLSRLKVRVNDVQYPLEELQCNFASAQNSQTDFARAFSMFLEGGHKMKGNVEYGSSLSAETYRALYPIFRVDVSHRDGSIFSSTSVADITIEATVNAGAAFTPYALVESERELIMTGVGRSFKFLL